MFVAMDKHRQLVTLSSHQQAEGLRRKAFFCPACEAPVRVRNGAKVLAHFAHVGPACEAASENESAVHLAGKRWLQALGERLGYSVALETYYPAIKQRADVVWQSGKRTIVLEFQCSPLNAERLLVRTAGYHRLGLDCIWILGPKKQVKSLTNMRAQEQYWQVGHDGQLHLWFCDGYRHLEDWQWAHDRYHIHRFTVHGDAYRQQPFSSSDAEFARRLGNQLLHREGRVMRLAQAAYQAHHVLGGVPWVVSQELTHLPGLKLPEWQLRTLWLLRFENQPLITWAMSARFFAEYTTPLLTPLVNNAKLLARVGHAWETLLETRGFLARTAQGWQWQRELPWYQDLSAKLAAMGNGQ